jgi:hypothetical protein
VRWGSWEKKWRRGEELLLAGVTERHHHLLEVSHFLELVHDARQGRSVQLRGQARKHQPHRPEGGRLLQVTLERVEVVRTQPVQGGDDAGLVKIAHAT